MGTGKTKKKIIYQHGIPFEVRPDGLFYAPDGGKKGRKHPCRDCHFCQWCAEIRCHSCRNEGESSTMNPAEEK